MSTPTPFSYDRGYEDDADVVVVTSGPAEDDVAINDEEDGEDDEQP